MNSLTHHAFTFTFTFAIAIAISHLSILLHLKSEVYLLHDMYHVSCITFHISHFTCDTAAVRGARRALLQHFGTFLPTVCAPFPNAAKSVAHTLPASVAAICPAAKLCEAAVDWARLRATIALFTQVRAQAPAEAPCTEYIAHPELRAGATACAAPTPVVEGAQGAVAGAAALPTLPSLLQLRARVSAKARRFNYSAFTSLPTAPARDTACVPIPPPRHTAVDGAWPCVARPDFTPCWTRGSSIFSTVECRACACAPPKAARGGTRDHNLPR